MCVSASAQPAASPVVNTQQNDIRTWLMRIHQAASHHNFQGTFVVSGGGMVSSARIAHFSEGANQFERSESLDGQARHMLRHNNVVTTLWPVTRIASVEKRTTLAQFPALLQAGDTRFAEFYELTLQGTERVAGHEAQVLWVKARDAHRYGYRLWAELASGLLLRADVLDTRNTVLETSAFSEVTMGVKPQIQSVLAPMKKLDGYQVQHPVMDATQLDAEGWTLREPAPGFRQVSCVKRVLVPGATRAEPHALHVIYADGLTYVSVFIEPFSPQRHTRSLLTALGATQTLMQRQGDWWLTLVGDVPPATLQWFANRLERNPKP
jgi:sigma-E factor negative regulatory protein RseB